MLTASLDLLCLCSAKQSIGIKDSKCPKTVQRQQQHQQQARNSKGEIQSSQINLMRRFSGQGDFFCTLPIVPTNLVVINEHDEGYRASMLGSVRRHH